MSAAFGRLCVETFIISSICIFFCSAAFGRLCVETKIGAVPVDPVPLSRLRAAVC